MDQQHGEIRHGIRRHFIVLIALIASIAWSVLARGGGFEATFAAQAKAI